MELKKNPKADVGRNSALFFVIGLFVVMLLTYISFEWKTYDKTNDYDISMNVEDMLDEEVPMTEQIKTPPPPPPPAAPEEEIVEVEDVAVDEIDEDIDVPFAVIEDVPIFPGCEGEKGKGAKAMRDCFQTMIQKHVVKNFRYPEISQEMGVQGKVYVNFVIQKDGSIGSVRMRGPDKNLEGEAARIIGKLPKMTPGKQRGRAVRVPFSLPITFKLQ